MPQEMLASVTCPICHHQFQAAVQQVLDVRTDPNAKTRVLNGMVNVAECPHCQSRGALKFPFLYHDPDNELALVYMPVEAGGDDAERQRAIGNLTNTVMDSLPPEERKGYLLQPQIFLTLENLTKKILEADGVTPEMIEEQKAKAELLQRMLDAASDEAVEAIIEENDASIDAAFFLLLSRNLEMAQAAGQESDGQQLLALRDKLLELSSEGDAIEARREMIEELRDQPTRDRLLELLVQASEERARQLLVTFGRPLLDYVFFQNLTSRIDAAPDKDERERLTALRKEILTIRDRLDEEAKALYEGRAELLRDLLLSDDPEALARRRLLEADEAFVSVLTANLEEAQAAGNEDAVSSLRAIWNLVLGLMEETMPPELHLFNRLLAAEDDTQIEELLQENPELVTDRFVESLESMEANARGEGESEAADRMAAVLEKMRGIVGEEIIT